MKLSPLQERYGSLPAGGDLSPEVLRDTSPAAARRACAWCRSPIRDGARRDSVFCRRRCRQAAFRIRRRHQVETANGQPKKVCYCDPPYPGLAWMYQDQPDYAGEVDHAKLVASLEYSYDGFALSTSAKALGQVLPLLTRPYRVCAWVKPIGVSSRSWGLHNAWEPLIVVPARELRPGKRDWLSAQPARRGGSDLIGRKPEAFCTWMFELLGLLPGDQLDDLYPGSGIVGRAWAELCRARGRQQA